MDTRLSERSLGVLEGRPNISLPAYDRGDLAWAPDGGEPYLSVTGRILSFLLDLPRVVPAECPRAIVSSHAGPLRILTGILLDMEDPAAVITTRFPNARVREFTVRSINWPRFLTTGATK
jgi:broad specificity phosphatase PhoE